MTDKTTTLKTNIRHSIGRVTSMTAGLHLPESPAIKIRLYQADRTNPGNYYAVSFANTLTIFDLAESVVFAFRDYYGIKIQDCRQADRNAIAKAGL